MANDIDIAKKVIEDIVYLSLATSNKQGEPWCSPLACAYDDEYNFYWYSGPTSLHSRNIKENSNVAGVLYDTNAKEGSEDAFTTSLYMKGIASVVPDDEVEQALTIIFTRFNKDLSKPSRLPKNFMGDNAVRKVYVFKPTEFSILLPEGDPASSNIYVDYRKTINISGK